MTTRWIKAAVLGATMLASGAQAATWKRAETPHYIVYSQGTDDQIRDLGFRLEMLDKTQRFLTRKPEALPPIKPVVYVLADNTAVQQTMAFGGAEGVAGYYNSHTRGPFMVTNNDNSDIEFSSQLVMFHELTHYYMFGNYPAAYPTWFTEGFADFIGASRVVDPTKMEVGRLSLNRYRTLALFEWLPVKRLIAAKSYGDVDNVYMLYAEGWLLTHYLTLGGARDGQLAKYLTAINQGKSFLDAAKLAFGDLDKLDYELRQYARRRTLPTRILEFRVPTATTTAVTAVSAAQNAMMLDDLRLMSGVGASEVADFAAKVKRDAAPFPNDPFALRLRTEAGLWAGDIAEATAAARQWLSVAPNDPMAMAMLGKAEIAGLKTAMSTDTAAWNAARARIAAAAKRAPREPLILRAYFESFTAQGKLPSEDAQNMLFTALDMNPDDDEVRYLLAADFEKRGLLTDAMDTIRLAAFASPEKDPDNDKQRQKIARARERYRMAGEELHETPRAMYTRLAAKVGGAAAAQDAP